MILASILITSDDRESAVLPPKVRENIDSFRKVHPGIAHRLFTGAMSREFLEKEFGREVVSAYDALTPYTYKANLARYCILHRFGGVYSDVSCFFFGSWLPAGDDGSRIGVFPARIAAPWSVPPTIVYAPQGHKALARAIELVLENVRKRYYGSTPLCPTGTVLFGKALALTCEPDEIRMGWARWVQPAGKLAGLLSETNIGFFDGQTLIAVKRKKGGGPQTELGIRGGNDYTVLWKQRSVYAD